MAYDLFKDSTQIGSVPATSLPFQTYTVTGLQPTTWYTFTVTARDAAGNVSGSASPLSVETEPADGAAPTAPGTLSVSQVTYTSALLSWAASSDSDDAVAAYDVYKAGTKIMTVPAGTTSARVLALQPSSTTAFTVKARDTEGNSSLASGTANVTTTALPGGQAIANPTGSYLTSTVSYSADYLLPFAFRRVFIDSDNNASTGYHTFSSPSIGADYVIEGSTLLRHVGATDAYTFDVVKSVPPNVSGNTITWQILVSDLGSPGATQKVTFQGDGFAQSTHSSVITLTQ